MGERSPRRVRQGRLLPLLILSLLLLAGAGCSQPVLNSPLRQRGCSICHRVSADSNHRLACTRCHGGDAKATTMARAHQGLVARPDAPWAMAGACGPCHPGEVERARRSRHFLLTDEISATWRAFFSSPPPTVEELKEGFPRRRGRERTVADLLARRCLRCHFWWRGDGYPMTRHALGCGACHLARPGEGPGSHHFSARVNDARCLACHRYSFVGWDYYGMAPTDTLEDFDAPLYGGRHLPRPFGLLWHEMRRDVHVGAGLACTDCHRSGPCTRGTRPSCLSCHLKGGRGRAMDPGRVGHRPSDRRRVSCEVCHGVWEPQDLGQEVVLSLEPPFDDWAPQARQGCWELEQQLLHALSLPEERWGSGVMVNKFSHRPSPGLWFWTLRRRIRWPVRIQVVDGRMEVVRPILDLCITDQRGERFCARPGRRWLPYHPHTVGRADLFRSERVARWLQAHGGGKRWASSVRSAPPAAARR